MNSFEKLLAMNREAMQLLRAHNHTTAYALLSQILQTVKKRTGDLAKVQWLQVKATTLNNLACYFRKYSS